MQFRVPQFIDVEDKLFGPLTFKQFLYLIGAGALVFLLWTFIPIKIVALVFIIPVAALGIALSFVQINNKPFIFTLEAAFNYFTKNRLYIWKKEPKKGNVKKQAAEPVEDDTDLFVPRLSQSKLKELSWGLDVYDTNKQSPD